MRLSKSQLKCLKILKDHKHPFNDVAFFRNRLMASVLPDTLWMLPHRIDERTTLSLERMGLIELPHSQWNQGQDGRVHLSATVKLTAQGLDAWLLACEKSPALRSL